MDKFLERNVMQELIKWKNSPRRKPLILRGARQVGKTEVLKEFGKREYKDIAYFSFDQNEPLKDVFRKTKQIDRVIDDLTFLNKSSINKGTTLIIFDEIQECGEALNTLKYFCEDEPEYHIACAGSLLGVRMAKTSFPVGKVNFINVYPMTFTEFLKATDHSNLVAYMDNIKEVEPIPEIFTSQLEENLKYYLVIGGMPEAVKTWIEYKDINMVEEAIKEILVAYDLDFSKHTSVPEANKINLIWKSVPSQLSRENKKFLYQVVKEGARAREYEDALNWLDNADIIKKVYLATANKLPLTSYEDLSSFKIYSNDVGLLRHKSELDSSIVIEGNRIFEEFKGALTENYVLQMMIAKNQTIPKYYTFDKYEIDFLHQYKNDILPVEVKSGLGKNANSLKRYNEEYNPKLRIRFSTNNLKQDDNLINIPLFMVEYLDRIIEIVK